MNETNKSLRIRTNVGGDKYVSVNLTSEYDTLDILSLKINQRGAYRYHTNTYGVVVGRVLANNGFGVPNAKLSLFITRDDNADIIEQSLYPYTSVNSKNLEGIRYNLLPSNQKDNCHQVVGTFPSKRMVLDDNSMIEVFDKYYLYTTRTNESGDYMFFGVPIGTYNLHMDLDISDCGKLSQRPRDFVYKGYNLEQFENPNQFKIDTELSALPQIFSQDTTIEVKPFWGDEKEGTNIGITREDINVQYKFEPTCVFMGSIVSDTPNDGINKRCVPTNRMGDMREMVTGSGTIEIIRKTVNHTVEELQIKGKQLINGNGVWCFQIPMNLDYITTDEYGNTVPTDNPDKGIPTRCEVRFRMSMDETQSESLQYKRGKVLVPNNPNTYLETDYEFGSDTKDESFKSLMWNGVYSVKSFIPRFQKSTNVRTNKFTGIKNVNIHGSNNPMPYNNIRIKIPFMFWLMCNVIKLFIRIIQIINHLKVGLMNLGIGLINLPYAYLSNEVCPDLEYWYFAPGMNTTAPSNTIVRKLWKWLTGKDNRCKKWEHESTCLTFKEIANTIKSNEGRADSLVKLNSLYEYIGNGNENLPHVLTYDELVNIVGSDNISKIMKIDNIEEYHITGVTSDYKLYSNWIEISVASAPLDKMSTEAKNALTNIEPKIHLTPDVDYLMQCVEMNLAQEYEVIKFDFYNDWINGVIYLPRWSRDVKYKKKRKNGKTEYIAKVKGCIDDKKRSRQARKYVQQCSISYDKYMSIKTPTGCADAALQCHKKTGMEYVAVLGSNGGAVHEHETMLGDYVYYMKPMDDNVLMFATDVIMIGSLFECNEYGIPSTFDSLVSTTYKLPTNLAMTNTDEDGYAYIDNSTYVTGSTEGPPTVSYVLNEDKFKCGDADKGCSLNLLAASGATATIPSYNDLKEFLTNRGDLNNNPNEAIVIEHDDIFPVTEMSGIEWGYTGPDQTNPSADKLFSPGGHFMGLACGNAETNIKSCVNLKRACEIGTTFSERLEIPIGFKEETENFDVVNYLYISPNGVIGKDQVVDVTFRSAFATMNQNSLKTETDPVTKHKKYSFNYLIPDSFDGTIERRLFATEQGSCNKDNGCNEYYNTKINLEWDEYWSDTGNTEGKAWFNDAEFQNEIRLESGHTITRLINTKSDDYIKFRHGTSTLTDKNFLKVKGNGTNKEYSMPIYKNSFYFYFGLKEGYTALDEFRQQFFASCAKNSIIGRRIDIEYNYKRSDADFRYDVDIDIINITLPINYTIQGVDNEFVFSGDTFMNDRLSIEDMRIGVYDVNVIDVNGNTIQDTIEIGVDNFSIDYDINSIVHYNEEENRTELSEFVNDTTNGGFISGSFEVTETPINELGITYNVSIECPENAPIDSIDVGSEIWNMLYKENKFYACGYGIYKVYIHELKKGVRNGKKYLYGTFTINDGALAPNVRIGTFDYFNEDGTSDFKGANFETVKEWDDYEKYRTIVSTEKMGTSFMLSFNYINTDKIFKELYAGKPISKTDGSLYNDVVLSTKVPNGYVLDFKQLTQEGEYYYTAYGENIFATPYKRYTVINEVNAEQQPTGKRYVDIIFNEIGYYCIVNGSNTELYHATTVNEELKYDDINENVDYIVVGLMVSAPLYFNPFAFKVIKSLNTNEYVAFDVQAYQNAITEEKVTRRNEGGEIIIDETKVAYSDGYNNINEARLKTVINKPELGKSKLKYECYNGEEVSLRLINLNESIKDKTAYYLHIPSNEKQLCFDSDGKFVSVKPQLNGGNYLQYTSDMEMKQDFTGSGEHYALATFELEYIMNQSVWAFGRYIHSTGVDNNDYRYNNKKECVFIKTYENIITICEPITLSGVTFKHYYTGDTENNAKIYEQQTDGTIIERDKNIYSTMDLKRANNTSDDTLTIIASENNDYRYGIIMQWKDNGNQIGKVISERIYPDKKVYFSQNEIDEINKSKKLYKVKFDGYFKNATIDVKLKEDVTDDITKQFSLVLAAKNAEGMILAHARIEDVTEIELTYEELINIVTYEVLFVANYNGVTDTGANADKDNGTNKTKLKISVKCLVDKNNGMCINIEYQTEPRISGNPLVIQEIYNSEVELVGIIGEKTKVDREYDNFKIDSLYFNTDDSRYDITFEKSKEDIRPPINVACVCRIDSEGTCKSVLYHLIWRHFGYTDVICSMEYNGGAITNGELNILKEEQTVEVNIPEFNDGLFKLIPTDEVKAKYDVTVNYTKIKLP